MVRKNVYIDCDKSPGSILTAFTLYLWLKLTRSVMIQQKSFWTFLSIVKWKMLECNQANKRTKSFLTFITLFISIELEQIAWIFFSFHTQDLHSFLNIRIFKNKATIFWFLTVKLIMSHIWMKIHFRWKYVITFNIVSIVLLDKLMIGHLNWIHFIGTIFGIVLWWTYFALFS